MKDWFICPVCGAFTIMPKGKKAIKSGVYDVEKRSCVACDNILSYINGKPIIIMRGES